MKQGENLRITFSTGKRLNIDCFVTYQRIGKASLIAPETVIEAICSTTAEKA